MRRLAVHILLSLAVAAQPWSAARAAAGDPTAAAWRVKAAFVCNFTQFVQWPADDNGGGGGGGTEPFLLGVLCDGGGQGGDGGHGGASDDDVFCDAVTQLAAGKTAAGGRPIGVRRVTTAADAAACQVVYVPASQDRRVTAVFDAVGTRAVLTIGDTDAFARAGGAIRFVPAGSKVRFEVHTPATKKANLKVSSKLLKVAIVVDH